MGFGAWWAWPLIASARELREIDPARVIEEWRPVLDHYVPFAEGQVNGWPAFEEAAAMLAEGSPAAPVAGVLPEDLWLTTATEAQRRAARRLVEAASGAGLPAALDRVADYPRALGPISDGTALGDPFAPGWFGSMRHMLRLCGGWMELAAESGDWDSFSRAFGHGLALSRVAPQQPGILARPMAHAGMSLSAERLRAALLRGGVPEPTMAAALAAIDKLSSDVPPMAMALECERGIGRAAFAAGTRSRKRLDHFYDRVLEASRTPRTQRRARGLDPESIEAELGRGDAVLKLLVPSVGGFLSGADQVQTELDATRLILAVLIHRERTGSLPESLGALAPGLLETLPLDPYSGGAFVYRITPGQGLGFVLYSVGADGRDDGGRAPGPDGSAFSPDTGQGFDAVYTAR